MADEKETWDFREAEEVADIAEELIQEHRLHDLGQAEVAYIFTAQATKKDGKAVLATTAKVSEKHRVAFGIAMQFVVTVSWPHWQKLSLAQQRAVVDHELEHCYLDEDEVPHITPHDVQEFGAIIKRHGLYLEDLKKFAGEIQPHLPGTEETLPEALARIDAKGAEGLAILDKINAAAEGQVDEWGKQVRNEARRRGIRSDLSEEEVAEAAATISIDSIT